MRGWGDLVRVAKEVEVVKEGKEAKEPKSEEKATPRLTLRNQGWGTRASGAKSPNYFKSFAARLKPCPPENRL
jgi:hypothetical protein